MKVLLRRNVSNLGKIGEVVEVKEGYARNYLIPQQVAVKPTKANLRAVELDKERYLAELAKKKEEIQAKVAVVDGKELTISARANEEGHLYGSIGPAQIVAELAKQDVFIEEEYIALDSPIRQLDKYDVPIKFDDEIAATISVWVVPVHDETTKEESVEVEAKAETETEESTEE